MKIAIDNKKVIIALAVIIPLSFPVVVLTTGVLRIALSLLLVVFLPGYTLLSALFPGRDNIGIVERLAFSLGLSIAIVSIVGLILNYTRWGIDVYPVLISMLIFLSATTAAGWYRQSKLPKAERCVLNINVRLPKGMSGLNKALLVSLAAAIVLASSCLGYAMATPKPGDMYTEFYILNGDSQAEGYAQGLMPAEPVAVIVGVVNHEYQPTGYRVIITICGEENSRLDTGRLSHDERWEREVCLLPQVTGETQKVEFSLYKQDADEPCFQEPLYMYIDADIIKGE